MLFRAVDHKALALDKAELARKKDLIALTGTSEPFAYQLFAVAVQTILMVSTILLATPTIDGDQR